jgi:hypothetical protein
MVRNLSEINERVSTMHAVAWGVLEDQDRELADYGQERVDGKVAYLATVRADGRPRAHPVTPIIGAGHLFIFVEPSSPRTRDLNENQDFCLHCAMNDSSGSSGEFQITGMAEQVLDHEVRQLAESVSSFKPSTRSLLFELNLSEVLATSYRGGRPKRHRWQVAEAMAENN